MIPIRKQCKTLVVNCPNYETGDAAADAPSRPVDPSCIAVSETSLVTRAILQRWRYAYANGTFEGLNDAENPP